MSARGRGPKKATTGAVKHIWTVEKAQKAGASADPRERYFINVKKASARRFLAGASRVFGPQGSPADIFIHTIVMPDGTTSEVRISGDVASVRKALVDDVHLTDAQAVRAIEDFALDRDSFLALNNAWKSGDDVAFKAILDANNGRLDAIWQFIQDEWPKGGGQAADTVRTVKRPNGEDIDILVQLGRAQRSGNVLYHNKSGSRAGGKSGGKTRGKSGGKSGGKKRTLVEKFAALTGDEGLLVSNLKADGTGTNKVAKGVKKQGYVSLVVDGKPLYSDNYAALERALDQIDPNLRGRLAGDLAAAQAAFQSRAAPPAAAAAMRTAAARPGSPGTARRTALTGRVLTAPS
jgi:hypothetical protein